MDPAYVLPTLCDSTAQAVNDQYTRTNVFLAVDSLLTGDLSGVCQPPRNITGATCDAAWNYASAAGWSAETHPRVPQCAAAAVGGNIAALQVLSSFPPSPPPFSATFVSPFAAL